MGVSRSLAGRRSSYAAEARYRRIPVQKWLRAVDNSIMGWIERRTRGRHVRSFDTWRPLPAAVHPGRHRRTADSPVFRSLAVMSILATLTTSTALGVEAAGGPPWLETQAHVVSESSLLLFEEPDAITAEPSVASTTIPTSITVTSTSLTTTTLPSTTTTTAPSDPSFGDIELSRLPTEVVVEFGGVVPLSLRTTADIDATPVTRDDCIRQAKTSPLRIDDTYDRNLIAQMTHDVFTCLTGLAGLDDVSPTAIRRWNGASKWGFGSLADQVASEAIVVAYCESEGFSPRALTGANGFGYAGLFQMGKTEMARFGESGSSRYDPVDNAVAAANYFIFQYHNRAGWGGWSPWAVVNTNFNDEVNDQVKVPVLPRFTSTDPGFRGQPGPELPAWAVDPWSFEVPHWRGTGCPYNGGRWPAATPLPETSPRTQG